MGIDNQTIRSINSSLILISVFSLTLIALTPLLSAGRDLPGPFDYEELARYLLPYTLALTYYCLFTQIKVPNSKFNYIFIAILFLWVQGQTMHLVANYMSVHFNLCADNNVACFLDEIFSHRQWELAKVLTFGYFLIRSLDFYPYRFNKFVIGTFALTNGIVWALSSIEGQTVIITLPFIIGSLVYLALKRTLLTKNSISYYITIYFLITLALLIAYFFKYSGFPELTQVGLL